MRSAIILSASLLATAPWTGPVTARAQEPVSGPAKEAAAVGPVEYRDAGPRAGTLAGRVIEEATSAPVAGAAVALVSADEAVVPARAGEAPAFARANQAVVTGPDGAYRFTGVPEGRYTLRVERLGFRPATVRIELRGAGRASVSVGLAVAPIRLEPVDVSGEARNLLNAPVDGQDAVGLGRMPAIRLRQARHLPTDVRVLAHDDLIEAVTLGETDIFRALHRLPGVTGWDDVSAELWTRGGGRGETLTLFDGLPLYEPLHGTGDLTAVSPDGIGMAFFHPGVRPADLGPGSAAVVDLRTRPGAGDAGGGIRGQADLSFTSARVALDGRSEDGRRSWMIAGRRGYVDLLVGDESRAFQGVRADDFGDVTGRVDLRLGGGIGLEASGLWQTNGYDGAREWLGSWSGGRRGTTAARATATAPLAGLTASLTAGVSRYRNEAGAYSPPASPPLVETRGSTPATDNALTHFLLRGELGPAEHGANWRAGYDLVRETARYDGGVPRPRQPYDFRDSPRFTHDQVDTRFALWGQRRWRVDEGLTIEAGVRAETGGEIDGADAVQIAPNLMARVAVSEHASLFAGLGRSYQYAQALAPTGIADILEPRSLWLLADDSIPALRSDIASAGGELWLGGHWLLGLNAYARASTGLVIPDPTPGDPDLAPLLVTADRRAHGVEASVRRVAGRATVSLAYSYGRATTEAAGLRFPSATDRTHTVDATGLVRLGRGFRVGGAFAYASGVPFTRTLPVGGGEDTLTPETWAVGPPNAHRGPDYRRFDLLLDWTHRFDRWGLGAYLKIRDFSGHGRVTRYYRSRVGCSEPGARYSRCDAAAGISDQFIPGDSGTPVGLGIRVSF